MVCSAAATAEATYAQSVEPAVRWLADSIPSENWRERLPQLAAYSNDHFDYEADERALELPGAMPTVEEFMNTPFDAQAHPAEAAEIQKIYNERVKGKIRGEAAGHLQSAMSKIQPDAKGK